MKFSFNKQITAAFIAIMAVLGLFYFGKTTSNKKPVANNLQKKIQPFDVQKFIEQKKTGLRPDQQSDLNLLEADWNSASAPDSLKLISLINLAYYWKDSLKNEIPYLHYISESIKLDNSEKNLNFAAQLFLTALWSESDLAINEWESANGISLFEKAIQLDPNNDELKIGLAGCYIFGKGRNGDPQETMKGIQELLGVVRRDSTNMNAQLMLGIGGVVSGQFDKAIGRLKKVINAQPDNAEAVYFLANAYTNIGPKDSAIYWLKVSQQLIRDPEYLKESEEKIKKLEQSSN